MNSVCYSVHLNVTATCFTAVYFMHFKMKAEFISYTHAATQLFSFSRCVFFSFTFAICCWCFNFCLLLLSIHLIHSTLDVLLLLPMPYASHLFFAVSHNFRHWCNISSFLYVYRIKYGFASQCCYFVVRTLFSQSVSCWPKEKKYCENCLFSVRFSAHLERPFFIFYNNIHRKYFSICLMLPCAAVVCAYNNGSNAVYVDSCKNEWLEHIALRKIYHLTEQPTN